MEGMAHGTTHAGSTPATVALRRAGVRFRIYTYEHSSDHMEEGYGVEAAERLRMDPGRIFKTLLASTGRPNSHGECVVGIVPASGHMDMKALAAAVGAKKLTMADPHAARRETGYVLGGISPFGQRSQHRTVLDASALEHPEILVSGGKRGFDVGIDPHDLLRVLHAEAAPIATR